jgi:hypothetical protein
MGDSKSPKDGGSTTSPAEDSSTSAADGVSALYGLRKKPSVDPSAVRGGSSPQDNPAFTKWKEMSGMVSETKPFKKSKKRTSHNTLRCTTMLTHQSPTTSHPHSP